LGEVPFVELCHLPTAMVAYPAARRVSAIVGASSGMSPK
jgi:hypothetical protein